MFALASEMAYFKTGHILFSEGGQFRLFEWPGSIWVKSMTPTYSAQYAHPEVVYMTLYAQNYKLTMLYLAVGSRLHSKKINYFPNLELFPEASLTFSIL